MVCPKCGGTTGYNYHMTMGYAQSCDWEGKEVWAEPSYGGTEGKLYECDDCYAVFRKSTIERLRLRQEVK